MKGKTVYSTIIGLLFSLVWAVGSYAADLQVSVNTAEQTITITNTLSQGIHLMGLRNGDELTPFSADIAAGSQTSLPFSGTLAGTSCSAMAIPAGEEGGLAGLTPAPEGHYLLSVDIM